MLYKLIISDFVTMVHHEELTGMWLKLLILVTMVTSVSASSCGKAAEEDTEYTIKNTLWRPQDGQTVTWKMGDLIVYDNSDRTENFFPSEMKASEPPNELTIFKVNQTHATTFTNAIRDKLEPFKCSLDVYKSPEEPTCGDLVLRADRTFSTDCFTRKTFPKATCVFKIGPYAVSSGIKYQYQAWSKDPVYYNTSCSRQNPVTNMGPGNYSVKVIMYASDVGLSAADGVSSTEQYLYLSLPTVELVSCVEGENVSSGYILPGKTVTCTCIMTRPGSPRGSINWYSPDGAHFAVLEETEDVSTIEIKTGGEIVCEGFSFLSRPFFTDSVTAIFASVPSSAPEVVVSSNHNGNTIMEGDDVTVTCTVDDGVPPVESVSLVCGQKATPITAQGTSVALTLVNIGIEYDGTLCICTASHLTQLYNLEGTTTLNVLTVGGNGSNSSAGPIIGAVVGVIVLLVFVIVICFVVCRRRGWRCKKTSKMEEGGVVYQPTREKQQVVIMGDGEKHPQQRAGSRKNPENSDNLAQTQDDEAEYAEINDYNCDYELPAPASPTYENAYPYSTLVSNDSKDGIYITPEDDMSSERPQGQIYITPVDVPYSSHNPATSETSFATSQTPEPPEQLQCVQDNVEDSFRKGAEDATGETISGGHSEKARHPHAPLQKEVSYANSPRQSKTHRSEPDFDTNLAEESKFYQKVPEEPPEMPTKPQGSSLTGTLSDANTPNEPSHTEIPPPSSRMNPPKTSLKTHAEIDSLHRQSHEVASPEAEIPQTASGLNSPENVSNEDAAKELSHRMPQEEPPRTELTSSEPHPAGVITDSDIDKESSRQKLHETLSYSDSLAAGISYETPEPLTAQKNSMVLIPFDSIPGNGDTSNDSPF